MAAERGSTGTKPATSKVLGAKRKAKRAQTAMPRRRPNADLREREWLTQAEVKRLAAAARRTSPRHGDRDATLIRLLFRHGLRVSQACDLRWNDFNFDLWAFLAFRFTGRPGMRAIEGEEVKALEKLRDTYPPSPYVFVTERGGKMTPSGIQKIVARAGEAAGFPFKVHPEMLRHACALRLFKEGDDLRAIQAYLGHKSLVSTLRYLLDEDRYTDLWKED